MDNRPKRREPKLDKSPYNRRGEAITEKGFKEVAKSVKPVAKDTNKTRRKTTQARILVDKAPTVKPKSNLKKDMKKSMKGKC